MRGVMMRHRRRSSSSALIAVLLIHQLLKLVPAQIERETEREMLGALPYTIITTATPKTTTTTSISSSG